MMTASLSPTWAVLFLDTAVVPGTNDYPATIIITAVVKNADGQTLTDGSVSWGTSAPSVATVTPTGPRTARVDAVGAGAAVITGNLTGATRAVAVNVLPAAP
jgi:uncharacterized protein YjdB